MIQEGMKKISFSRNLVVKKEGCSKYFSPYQIIYQRNIDYNKEFQFSFGSYCLIDHKNKPTKNDPRPRDRDAIYLRASRTLQGGHHVLDLMTGRVITRQKVTEVKLTDAVVKRVN